MARLALLPICAVLLAAPIALQATEDSDIIGLRACLNNSNALTCDISPGVHLVDATITVPRSGVTIAGLGVSPADTTLKRATGSTYIILQVAGGVSGVTVHNLQFDGSRNLFNCPSRPSTPEYTMGCPCSNLAVEDVEVDGFADIDTVWFINAPGTALGTYGGYVAGSYFDSPRSTALYLWTGGVTVSFNSFYYAGTAAITLWGSGNWTSTTWIFGNYMYKNRYEMPDGSGGGQLTSYPQTANAIVLENTIDGAGWSTGTGLINGCIPPSAPQTVAGMEIGGSGHAFYNNEIVNNSSTGLELQGTSNTLISGNDPYCSGSNIPVNYGSGSLNCTSGKYIHYNSQYGIWANTSNGLNTNLRMDNVQVAWNQPVGISLDSSTTGIGFADGNGQNSTSCIVNNGNNTRTANLSTNYLSFSAPYQWPATNSCR